MVKESLQLSLQDFTWIINNYAYSGRLLKCMKFFIFETQGNNFLISLATIPNDQNVRFRSAIFIIGSCLLRFTQNDTKSMPFSTAKTLLFMTMQKLCSYSL